MAVRVLLVDDHPLVREALRYLIGAQPDMEVVGDAADAASAFDAVAALAPDVVIMDIELPGDNGIEATRRVLAACPGTRVVILSAHADAAYVIESVRAGVSGYLLKGNATSEVMRAIRSVVDGHTFMCPEATSALAAACRDSVSAHAAASPPVLSQREREVLLLVADGLRTKEIAARLDIGAKTVDTYRARLMAKLKCNSTAELVRYAIREGLMSA
jgi:two-component system NarL family response regulator